MKVLVVDDQAVARKIASITFHKTGCQVDCVVDASAALHRIVRCHYDLIVIDLGLPDMDGTQLCREIRQMDHPNARAPIVILTANGDDHYRECCSRMGISDYILKPITPLVAQRLVQRYSRIAQE